MSQQNASYWTKRRRIHQAVAKHVQEIQSANSSETVETSNSECGVIHTLAEEPESTCRAIQYDVTPAFSAEEESNLSDSSDTMLPESDEGLRHKLVQWAVAFNISHVALNRLLETLREYHPDLPRDSRGFLNTPRFVDVQDLAGGSYYHFGIIKGVTSKLKKYSMTPQNHLTLQVNIDGLPLFKSSTMQLWPILGMVDQIPKREPFIIGLFSGHSKPLSAQEFLKPFIDDLMQVESNGFLYNGQNYHMTVSAVICDTPARSFVKCVKGHNGYFGCDKCIQSGEWNGTFTI